MAHLKDDMSSVATYADHEVITPPHTLRKAVTFVTDSTDDPVARAEAALSQLSGEFSGWMHSECERLDAARQEVRHQGSTANTHGALFRAAHDIKGEAATFGFPVVAGIADSLCRLIEHTPEKAPIPAALVDQHVDAVRAIVREYDRPDLALVADVLTRRLREVTDEFLKKANSTRPDYLESIFAPSIAPEMSGG